MYQPCFAVETFTISYENGRVVRSYPEISHPVIGLALSGGGARGCAHIGVIEELEKNGLVIERIAGTSMGSIVGGLYAAGYSTKSLATIVENLDWADTFSNTPNRRSIYVAEKENTKWPLLDLRFRGLKARMPQSLSSGQKIITQLSWLTLRPTFESGGNFEKLPIPFNAVTTNLINGDTVILKNGNLARAMQASSTIPLIFSPVEWDGKLLVDGGLKNNLPVNVARDMGSDFVIGVAIDESIHPLKDLDNPINIADQTTSILMRNLTILSMNQADFIISPYLEDFSSNNFTNLAEIIEQGRITARESIPALLNAIAAKDTLYKKSVINSISVSPKSEEENVLPVLLKEINTGKVNYYPKIINAFEKLWGTGRYLKIYSYINESNGMLNITLVKTPQKASVVFSDLKTGETKYFLNFNNDNKLNTIISSVDSLVYKLRFEGNSFAKIDKSELNADGDTLNVSAVIPRITNISIYGNNKTRHQVITREFYFNKDDIINQNNLMKTVESLYGTDFFELVYLNVKPFKEGVGLQLCLKEKDLSVLRFGFHHDETNSTEGRVLFSWENIFGLGNRFTAASQTGKRKQFFLLQNRNDRIYKTFYTFDIKTYNQWQKRPVFNRKKHQFDYEDSRYGTVVSLGQQMDKLGNAMLQFKTESLLTNYPSFTKIKDEKKELRSLIFQSIIDSYDKYPFPKNGKINVIYIESSNEFFGGTEKFVKFYLHGSAIKTYANKHSIFGSYSLGTSDPSTPKTESFTLGGTATKLNCYNYETSFSHFYSDFQGLEHENKTGNYLANVKMGYRLFVPKYFYLSLIYNIGNVWQNNETINFSSVLQGYGAEGSFSTNLGPITFGWGKTSNGSDMFHFAAGWEF